VRQVPVSMFTVLFAVARTVGWVAQWAEMAAQQQSAPKISRPRQARAPAPETLSGHGSRAAARNLQAMADAGDAACFHVQFFFVLGYIPGSCPRDSTRRKQSLSLIEEYVRMSARLLGPQLWSPEQTPDI